MRVAPCRVRRNRGYRCLTVETSPDGFRWTWHLDTFSVRDGIIVSTGFPTGLLRTEKQYENFIMELEWRHLKPGGNAGVFVWGDALPAPGSPFARGIEVQVLDNGFNVPGKNEWYTTHGDVFPIHGATMTTIGAHLQDRRTQLSHRRRSKTSPEWNHYRIEGNNGVLRLSVNGKEVTVARSARPQGLPLPGIGRLGMPVPQHPDQGTADHESAPEEIANAAVGYTFLYNGVDLRGWKTEPGHAGHWQPNDWILAYDGKGGGGQEPVVGQGVRRLRADLRLALDRQAEAGAAPAHPAHRG